MAAATFKGSRRRFARCATVAATLTSTMTMAMAQPASAALSPPVTPAAINVPAGHVPFLLGHARGYQIYRCQPQGGGYAWVLQQPWAGLVDDAGGSLAIHYGGPTWRAADNSTVVGARVAGVPAPSPTAIPWLLLVATSTSGNPGGTFLPTTYIQRINTVGGLAPATGCDSAHAGATAPVVYTADYWFYRAA